MKFQCVRDIEEAGGTQVFETEAGTKEEALERFIANKGVELVDNECEVTSLSEWDIENIWVAS